MHRLRAEVKRGLVVERSTVFALIDANLQVLDELEGGASTVELRAALVERERQVRLGLADLFAALGRAQAAVGKIIDSDDAAQDAALRELERARFIGELIGEMLDAKKAPAWHREWSWYAPRVAEEFGDVDVIGVATGR